MINDIKNDAQQRMNKSLESTKSQMNKVRTGRAHPSLLDSITVSYYGVETPLNQVANVSKSMIILQKQRPRKNAASGSR